MKDFSKGIIYYGNRKFVPVGDENKILWQERKICSGLFDPEAVWEEDVGKPLPLTELPAETRSLVPDEWLKQELLRREEARRSQIRRQEEEAKAEAEKAKAEAETRARAELLRPARQALGRIEECFDDFSEIVKEKNLTQKVKFFKETLGELTHLCRKAETAKQSIPDGEEFDSFRRKFNDSLEQVKKLLS